MANIVITGAGKGLGAALLMAFARESGHKITGFSRNTDSVRQQIDLQEDILSDIHLFSADLVTESPESIVQKITQHLSSVDILINNAGFLVAKPFSETSSDDFDTIFNTNVKSVYFLIQQLLPQFAQNSHIVNIGSMGGFPGSKKFSGISAYSISKGALATLSECLAEELAPQNIRVNCLAMGAVQTEMLAEAFPGFKAPLQASEMAEFIRNFALNAHHYLNGKVIPLSISTP
jgi:NAD(P)-dependent dehydrogenase (short-subunit alcohol dehydrogenase family)